MKTVEPMILRRDGESPFHTDVKCCVRRFEYDFDSRTGVFFTEGSPDWRGTIAAVLAVDQDALRVYCISEDGYGDTLYCRRDAQSQWSSFNLCKPGRYLTMGRDWTYKNKRALFSLLARVRA
jgi:hypothetical protein